MRLSQRLPDAIRRSYFRQFVAVVAVVMLVVAGTGVVVQGMVSTELREEKHREIKSVAELEADNFATWVEENERTVRMLSSFEGIQRGDREAVGSLLTTELERLPDTVQSIHYVDRDSGEILLSTDEADVGSSIDGTVSWVGDGAAFDATTDTAISKGFVDDGVEQVAFGSPIDEGTMVVMTVDASDRANHFRNPVQGGYTQVVDSEGIVEFAAQESVVLEPYAGGGDDPALQAGLAGESGVVERDGELVGYAPVAGTDWVVLTHAPTSSAYALRTTVRNDILLLIGLSLLGFVALGLTIGRSTVRSLADLSETAARLEEGDLETAVESDRIDEIGDLYAAFDSMRVSLRERIAEMDEFLSHLDGKAVDYRETMGRAADGDLTVRVDPESDSEAIAEVGETFNRMIADLEGTVDEVQTFADDVAAAAEEVTASTDEVEEASEQVAESVSEISSGTVQQEENLQSVSDEMTDLSATVEEIASSSDEVATTSRRAAERGREGSAAATEAIDDMEAIETRTEETAAEVRALEREMAEINDIVGLIENVAEQTNLLALNASIEAARAGEAGEGFAVVASEIKTLAEEVAASTTEIAELVEEVQGSAGTAVADMEAMHERVATGSETVEEALSAFQDLVDAVEAADSGVQSISEATDEQATSAEQVVGVVDEVAGIGQQTAAEAQSVSAAAEEQAASISEVADSADHLATRSVDLSNLLSRFEVRSTGDGTATGDAAPDPTAATGGHATAMTDGSGPDRG